MSPIHPEAWRRISALLDQALALPAEDRQAFLRRACAADPPLLAEAERALAACDESSDFLESAGGGPAAALLRDLVEQTETLSDGDAGGEAIGAYRLLQKIGEGGMGEVWLAQQTEPLRRRVALKLIKAGMDTRQVVARFEAERQALALMDHPAIARVYDAGETPRGLPYFVMEFVQGEPITTYCDRHTLSTRARIDLFLQVCDAVQHAHQKGIIHRDLKPSNVLVTVQGDKAVPKVIDFGVAKATAHRLTEKTVFTERGVLIGTPEYMSPEQAEMTGLDVDTRTDVYALGMILYELLVGAHPFDIRNLRRAGFDEMRRVIREVDPPLPSARLSTLGEPSDLSARNRGTEPARLADLLRGDLDWITMKALEKQRTRRYGSANELAADIGRYLLDEPVLAGPPGTAYRARKFVRRHRLGVSVAAVGVVVLVGFAATMTVQAARIARERTRAERVSAFLLDLFRQSDPNEARGNTVTARELLDVGAERIEKGMKGSPEIQSEMMLTLGLVYFRLGLYRSAEPLLTRALELRRGSSGLRHPDVTMHMAALADLYFRQGRYPEAEALMTETLAIRRRALGEDHPATLDIRFGLACVHEAQGRYDEAGRLFREVLEGRRRLPGDHSRATAASLNSLGSLYERQGRDDEAAKVYGEVVESLRRTVGEEHPDTLWAMNNLARAASRGGRTHDAETLCLRTLEIRRRVLGEENPDTLATKHLLASIYDAEGRHAEAEGIANEVLVGQRRVLGTDHPATVETMNLLAGVLAGEHRLEEARDLHRQVLESRRRALGNDHPETLQSLARLAGDELTLGRRAPAGRMYREALTMADQALGREHPVRIAILYNLGCVAALSGDRPQALDSLRQAVEGGFRDADAMANDPDLASLRGDPEFEAIVAAARRNREMSAATGGQPAPDLR